jgi:methyl-accepting chemotaxis protein
LSNSSTKTLRLSIPAVKRFIGRARPRRAGASPHSLIARLFVTLAVLLVLMGGVIMAVTRTSLQSNARQLIDARRVKELAVTSLALRLTQESITEEMLLDPEHMDGAVDKIEAYDRSRTVMAQMDSLAASDTLRAILAHLRRLDELRLRPLDTHILELMAAGKAETARQVYFSEYRPVRAEYEGMTRQLTMVAEQDAIEAARAMAARNQRAFLNISLSLGVGLALVLLALFVVGSQVRAQLEVAIATLEAVARGDLTQVVAIESNDEIGRMAASINRMSADLRAIIAGIKSTSERLVTSSATIAATVGETAESVSHLNTAIDQIAEGARDQAASTQETVQVMADMSAHLVDVAERTATIANAGDATVKVASIGSDTVGQAMIGFGVVRGAFINATAKIRELGEYSERIGSSTEVMRQIADQTNLLALNAAIEAARAGQHGRGFGVVAMEVRALAESSEKAADEIAEIVRSIQSGIGDALQAMEEGTHEVASGTELTTRAQHALQDILSAVNGINTHFKIVSSSTQEIAQSVKRATRLVTDVAGVAQQSAASAEKMAAQSVQVATAIQHLASLSTAGDATVATMDTHADQQRTLAHMAHELQRAVGSFTV